MTRTDMKHNFLWILPGQPRWTSGLYAYPFAVLQCANCKEYWVRADKSHWYVEHEGELVRDYPLADNVKCIPKDL